MIEIMSNQMRSTERLKARSDGKFISAETLSCRLHAPKHLEIYISRMQV